MLLTTILVTLEISAYPRWRILSVGALNGVSFLYLLWEGIVIGRRGQVTERRLFTSQLVLFAPLAAVIGLTGGLASPLLPSLLLFAVGSMAVFGRSVQSYVSVMVVAITTILFGFLPPAWRGPPLSYGVHITLAGFSILYALLMTWTSMVVIGDAYCSAWQRLEATREDVIAQATGRARSLEAISSKLAHELKNPLAAIKGLVQLLSRSQPDEKTRERLDVVTQEVLRMEAILRDYLSFSRPFEALSLQPVALESVVDDVLQMLEARAEDARIHLRKSIGAGTDITVVGDARRLKEALLNLVTNALDATPSTGTITVAVRASDRGAQLEVSDTGRGIAPDQLERVGTPFFTTREGGTGLGVVLARMVVRQHGGEMSYASRLGVGTTVTVTLPDRPSEAKEAESEHGTCPFGGR